MLDVLFSSLLVLKNVGTKRPQVVRQETRRCIVETSLVSDLTLVGYYKDSLLTGDNKFFRVAVAIMMSDHQHWLLAQVASPIRFNPLRSFVLCLGFLLGVNVVAGSSK
jgi:hypothetical protein